MTTKIPYDFMPPEQHFRTPEELRTAIENYQESRVMDNCGDQFMPPEGKFEKISNEDGGFVLMPTTMDYAFLYRGQCGYHNPCLPTLQREKRNDNDMFLERMRIVEFELMLKQYPSVQFFEYEKFEVDYVGLAQHYGLNTDVLDLTSDIRTALFFAMCDYDRVNDCYNPKKEDKEYIGYIYAYPVLGELMKNQGEKARNFLRDDLKVIGLQPFSRPGSQRGYSLHITEGKAFKGYLYSFSYTRKDSEEYYDNLIKKRYIWDADFIVERTKRIKESRLFSFDALALATKRYAHHSSLAKMQKRMNEIGIHFTNNLPWKLTAEEKRTLYEQFEKEQKKKILEQIVQRQLNYGEKVSPTTTLSFVAAQLTLQALQGGQPSIEGYDSGICFCLEDEPQTVGWEYNTSRPQTEPDKDGKITAFDTVLLAQDANSQESLSRRMELIKRVKEATKSFKMQTVFVTEDGRSIELNEAFIRIQDAFLKALNSNDLKTAQELDDKLMEVAGVNGRVVCEKTCIPARPLISYAFNRAILKLRLGRVEEAALSMNDATRILFYSDLHEEVYCLLNWLAEGRGKHNIFDSPYETACDYLMMAIICQPFFSAISLSFFWKAIIIFKRLGMTDIERFTDGLIGVQCHQVSECYKEMDSYGSELFKEYYESKGDIKFVVPHGDLRRRYERLQETQSGKYETLSKEEKQTIFGPLSPHLKTLKEEKMVSVHWPAFSVENSFIKKACDLDGTKTDSLPTLFQVMEMICYEEEKYAITCSRNELASKIIGEVHEVDGLLEQVVGDDGRYLFMPKGIINNLYYRGQTKFVNPSRPSLYRDRTERDVFIERIKACEFSILMRKHPSCKRFMEGSTSELKDGNMESHEMLIDDEALAQHYGILTEYMDVTTDKWVAAFFACADYHRTESGSRDYYNMHVKQDTGVFYVYQDINEKLFSGELHPVGLQPFSRPVVQAGYVLKMKKEENFNELAHGIRFRYDSGSASIIYWLFDQSLAIQPEEVIELKVKRIVEEGKTFSRHAFELAHQRYYSSMDNDEFYKLVDEYDLKIQEGPLVDFSDEEIAEAENEFGLQRRHLTRTVVSCQMMTLNFAN